MIRSFNHAMVCLYDLAERASHNDFPIEALHMLRQWINFDGAVLGMSSIDAGTIQNVLVAQIPPGEPDHIPTGDFAQLLAAEFISGALLRGMSAPIQYDCRTLSRIGNLHCLHDFAHDGELHHLMLFGDTPSPHKAGRWLILYRCSDTGFNAQESGYLQAAWFHLTRALDMNRLLVLYRHDRERAAHASALINVHGFVVVADQGFHHLLHCEWPDYRKIKLPPAAMGSLMRDSLYRGRHIEIDIMQRTGYMVCAAKRLSPLASLTRSEYRVAQHFANGLSHKSIARELGISPHTVRNKIAHLYHKLGINNKAALARHISALPRLEDDKDSA